ncbi:MFS domain-containing protein [Mycena chlorophos]|uniref:MFS domain-containing protein n=1 Tax=Mycena chlorophos TaxID=658473 RepID=A0A8H6TJT9_MYCCL|nr:MFS domain-containing protein [Mycena chlorophos]
MRADSDDGGTDETVVNAFPSHLQVFLFLTSESLANQVVIRSPSTSAGKHSPDRAGRTVAAAYAVNCTSDFPGTDARLDPEGLNVAYTARRVYAISPVRHIHLPTRFHQAPLVKISGFNPYLDSRYHPWRPRLLFQCPPLSWSPFLDLLCTQTPATESIIALQSDHEHENATSHPLRARLHLCAIYTFRCFLRVGMTARADHSFLESRRSTMHVGFLVVSLTFVVACIVNAVVTILAFVLSKPLQGFISGALFNLNWASKIGFGRMIIVNIGALGQVVAYTIQAPAPPFPVFVISFGINGLGNAIQVRPLCDIHPQKLKQPLQNAQTNTYVASLGKNSEFYMGLLHASYGAGALSSPLIATQFASMPRWSFHYLVSLGLAVLNVTVLTLTFRFRSLEDSLHRIGQRPQEELATSTNERSNFGQIFSLRAVHLLAFFALLYVGVEVTIGGWITTYIIDVRGAGHEAGYVSSGFFGGSLVRCWCSKPGSILVVGLMMGRVALLWLNQLIGEQYVLYLYSALIIGLELLVWFLPSLIGSAISVCLVGLFLGPFYPIIMNRTGRIVPRWLLSGSIGWIAGFGQAGSALIPFVTGAIASKSGIKALQPLIISLMACFPIVWTLVPRSPRRID